MTTLEIVARVACPACGHLLGEHEHRFEYAPTPTYETWTCEHPGCDCKIER